MAVPSSCGASLTMKCTLQSSEPAKCHILSSARSRSSQDEYRRTNGPLPSVDRTSSAQGNKMLLVYLHSVFCSPEFPHLLGYVCSELEKLRKERDEALNQLASQSRRDTEVVRGTRVLAPLFRSSLPPGPPARGSPSPLDTAQTAASSRR